VSTLFDIVGLLGTSIDALLGAEEAGADDKRAAPPDGAAPLPADALGMPNRLILERAADHPAIELETGVQ
jgi:hypothetical protein